MNITRGKKMQKNVRLALSVIMLIAHIVDNIFN